MESEMGYIAITGAPTGGVRLVLRLEGAALFAAATALYFAAGAAPGWLFALLFLAPDLSFLAYLAGPRSGAIGYNLAHSTIGPLVLGGAGAVVGTELAVALALIWLAHIGIDRLLGYGLKYRTAFGDTHLGRVGRVR